MTKTDQKTYGIAFKDSFGTVRTLNLPPMSMPQASHHRDKLEAIKPGIQFYTVNLKSE